MIGQVLSFVKQRLRRQQLLCNRPLANWQASQRLLYCGGSRTVDLTPTSPRRCGQAGHVNPQLTDTEMAAFAEAETGGETRIIAWAEHVHAAQGSGMSP